MKSLAQTHGDCILQLGPAHFDDVVKFFGFPEETFFQSAQFFQKRCHQLSGGGNDIIGGLCHIHMIVGMHFIVAALFSAQQLIGTVGNDFVDVHVGAGSGASLDGIDDEFLFEFSTDHFITGTNNRVGFIRT